MGYKRNFINVDYNHLIMILLLVVCGTVFGSYAASADNVECLDQKYKGYAEVKREFQNKLALLIAVKAPRYNALANTYKNDQVNLIELNTIAVEFLLDNHPDKVHTDRPLNEWIELTDELSSVIGVVNSRFRELALLRAEAKTRPVHPDAAGLREAMKVDILPSPEYVEIVNEMSTRILEIELRECNDNGA